MELARPEQDAHGVHPPGHDRRPGLRRQDRLGGDAVHGQDRARGHVRPTTSRGRRSRPTWTACWSTTRSKGHQVEYVGKEDVEGTPAYKLKVTQKNGDVVYVYIDAEQLPGDQARPARPRCAARRSRARRPFGDFKKVDGLVLPFSIEQKAKGVPGRHDDHHLARSRSTRAWTPTASPCPPPPEESRRPRRRDARLRAKPPQQ